MSRKKAFISTDAGPMVFDVNTDTKTIQAKLRPATLQEMENEFTDAFVSKEAMPVATQIESEVNAAIRETLDSVKTGVKQFIMHSMGFEKDSWGNNWKIDHCNGRMSNVSDYVNARTQEIIAELDLKDALKLTEKEKADIRTNFHREMKDRASRLHWSAMNEAWQAAMKAEVTKLAQETVESMKDEIRNKAIEALYGPK